MQALSAHCKQPICLLQEDVQFTNFYTRNNDEIASMQLTYKSAPFKRGQYYSVYVSYNANQTQFYQFAIQCIAMCPHRIRGLACPDMFNTVRKTRVRIEVIDQKVQGIAAITTLWLPRDIFYVMEEALTIKRANKCLEETSCSALCTHGPLEDIALKFALSGSEKLFKDLVKRGGFDLKKVQWLNMNLAHIAVKFDYEFLVSFVIQYDIDIYAKDSEGKTAMDHALASIPFCMAARAIIEYHARKTMALCQQKEKMQ